jgi:hypothetical protein
LKYLKTVFIVSLVTLAFFNWARGEEKPVQEVQVIGEFFGQPVPAQNYFFVKSVLLAFANRLGLAPQSEEELEGYAWDYLLLSYEAFQNNIAATPEEISAEIKNILKEDNVRFDWNKDKDAFARWVKEKTNQTLVVFENQVRFIVEINKLRQQIINSLTVGVSEEEAHRAFQDEHNSISVDVIGFLKQEEARAFYDKARENPTLWEEQKTKQPGSFKHYEFATLTMLMAELEIDRDTLYKMLQLTDGQIYQALPIVRGFGVLKILNKKLAEEVEYAKLKYSYVEQIKEKKKNEGFQEWFGMVKQKAKIKIYKRGG